LEKKWTRLTSEKVFENRLFEVIHKRYRLDVKGREAVFATISTADWINVIPVTDEGNFVLIRQFRHGVEEETVEIPGGAVDEGDGGPLEAAKRELREETGYGGGQWELLGVVAPNPAIQDNMCFTYLAKGVSKEFEKDEDAMECIEVFEATPGEVKRMLTDGSITHALVLAAFCHYFLAGYSLSTES